MALTLGTRLGVYEIIAPIGEGGMGQVFRARDTKLDRDVAIKILPEAVAHDADRLARFTREAKTLASLNHPNIAGIYGLEESGGVSALVMELVEGEDLSQRIARGAIPLDEALPIAKKIAEALEAAHEQGIIHRDLKPANIKVRADGAVKVLDFGLAKAMDPLSSSSAAAALANSPTITSPAAMTAAGIILGTAVYMSPEQARGKVVDKRTDLWAFGCVLYEMVAGLRPFGGDDVTDTIAAVVRADPDWSKLRADTPTAIRRLLRRCLEKDRMRRLPDAADARLEIDEALSPLAGDTNTEHVAHPASEAVVAGWQRVVPWGVAGVAIAALMLVVALWAPWRAALPPRVTRTTITTSGQAALTIGGFDRDLAVSPDGTHVVYVGNSGTQLFVRALDALEPVAITTGGSLRGPFVSPDGQWVGFIDRDTTLKKVAISGGPSIALASLDGVCFGATWASDDTIIFATANRATGLQRVSDAGGTPEVLTRPDHAHGEASHAWPQIVPGGHAILFTITQLGGTETAQVAVHDLRTGTHKTLLRGGSDAHYVATGLGSPNHAERERGTLVYVADGALRAIAFDPISLQTYGTAVPVLPRLVTTTFGTGDFAVATDGTLVYVDAPGSLATNARTLAWVDRTGQEESLSAPPRAYQHPRLSPDGTRVALSSLDQENDLWIWDLARARLTRLTLDPGLDQFPVWMPDGRRIVFSSARAGESLNLWWQAADGTGIAERLTTSSNQQLVTGITPDGAAVIFFEATPTMGFDLMRLAIDGTRRVTPLLQTKFDERNGIVSPDGRWLAYESNSSGPTEIYVRPFPNVGDGQWLVSTAGGTRPLWARSGKELFYIGADGALLRVPVEARGATWNAGTPTTLFERRYVTGGTLLRTYDVSPDGRRFLMVKALGTGASAVPPAVIVVQHWDEELKRLVPAK